ncbi:substrate-binding domain-containing protein [candidate division KSB1 bacterium]|nr:substrate-binding domain-containing protein [candidate division KSB1 bacterium]
MRSKIYLLAFILFLLSLGCDRSPTKQEPLVIDVSHFTIQNYPRVDGSTSAHPLQNVIACYVLGINFEWYDAPDGTRRIYPDYSDTTKKEIRDYIINTIQHHGTHEAYVNLISDSADVILVARGPSDDELKFADSLGVSLDVKEVALDAFVFILNVNIAVDNLTIEQIRGIYTGNITNWRDLGGSNSAINAYQREPNSGSQELMEALVMKGLNMVNAPEMILFTMISIINMVELDPWGIGYTVYYYEEFMARREAVKLCAVNDVKPNYENIYQRRYDLTAPVFAVIRADLDKASNAYLLWQWMDTTIGQQVVASSGYIPAR